jgi:hypothetical protein
MYVIIFFRSIRTLKNANQIDSKFSHSLSANITNFLSIAGNLPRSIFFNIDEVSFLSYFRLMWYLGKDILADEEATQGIIERLDTEEGIALKK